MKKAELKAEEILNNAEVKSVPVNIEDIAKKHNVIIRRASNNEFSGLLFRKEGVAFMAINNKEAVTRQRFTIAHELGHYFLHPQKDTFVEFRDNKKNTVRGVKEIQANQFAAAVLMPRKFLIKDIKKFNEGGLSKEDLKFLAQKYQVSEDAMNFRLINLNLSI